MLLSFVSIARSTVQTLSYTQMVDHFARKPTYFTQRYFVNSDYANKSRNIILYLGGANELDPNEITSGPILEIASQTKSVIIGLEHRYFGKSVPTVNMSQFNMQYCSVPQAILDIKSFVLQGKIRNDYCTEPDFCKFFLMGKGYGGGLATWASTGFKRFYLGAWASSAPLVSINTFTQYDQKEAYFLGNITIEATNCYKVMHDVYNTIETVAVAKNESTKYMMQNFSIPDAENFMNNTVDFLYMFSEAMSRGIRNSSNVEHINNMCKELHQFKPCFATELIKILSNYTKIFTNNSFYDLRPQLGLEYGPMRPYFQLKCHDLGGFPVSNGNLRSPLLNSSYYNDQICLRFLERTLPDPDIFNRLHLGTDPQTENIIFTIGEYDQNIDISCTTNNTDYNRFAFIIKNAGFAEDFEPDYDARQDDLKFITGLAINKAVEIINNGQYFNMFYVEIIVGTISAVILLFTILLIILCVSKSGGKPDLSTQPLMSQNLN